MILQLIIQLIFNLISSQGTFPCTADQFFNNLISDDSTYTTEYRTARQDKDINVSIQYSANSLSHALLLTRNISVFSWASGTLQTSMMVR